MNASDVDWNRLMRVIQLSIQASLGICLDCPIEIITDSVGKE